MPVPLHVAVLAAGEGTRLRGAQPKVLTPLWGRPAVSWPVSAAAALGPERLVVVTGRHREAIAEALAGHRPILADQGEPQGTGHAVLAAGPALEGAEGDLLVLYGDCPLVSAELLEQLLERHRTEDASLTLAAIELDDPTGYGRLVRGADGELTGIVEEADADPDQRALREVNSGVWVVSLPWALEELGSVGRSNAQGEVYLTDLVARAVATGRRVATLTWPVADDLLGFNDQRELAAVRGLLRRRIVEAHLAAGVEIVDPETTYIDAQVTIEAGARILPCTMIEGRVSIAAGCEVGPFTHLRDGTVLEAGSSVGNFTETKKTRLGPGSKARHLTYLGDAEVGAGSNIGAGTITANYDGKHKHPTQIGEGVFIGSGTVLVAPATVGDGAKTGAGAIVTGGSIIGQEEVWVGVPARALPRPVTGGAAPTDGGDR